MSSFIRRATAAGALIVSATLGTTVGASATPSPSSSVQASSATAAEVGGGWLGRQISHGFISTNGSPDPSATAQAVLALSASDVGGRKAKQAMAWLKKHFESYVSPGGVDDPGALATVALAAESTGNDPTAFGGKKTQNDLLTRLVLTQRTTGTDAGLFGSADPTFDGVFRQGLSLMALAEHAMTNAAGVTWLKGQQCADGGWESYRSDTGTACPAPDPDTFSGPDTNSTSVAVEALVATGSSFPVAPTAFFESSQNVDGGFGFIGDASQSPDPDSTGEVIQALVALHELTDPAFTQTGGATPTTALDSFQLGCSAATADRGAYFFPGSETPDLLATLQAVPGAAEMAFPLGGHQLKAKLPEMKCPAP